jgi:hypothetical protein
VASEVEICNMALSQVRGGSINNLDQTTAQAQQCKLWYAKCRDYMLANTVWNFSRRIVALAQLSEEEVFNWRYVYAYPVDCLHINRVIPNIQLIESDDGTGGIVSPTSTRMNDPLANRLAQIPSVEYMVMNNGTTKVIVCNEPNARIDFRARIIDVNRMTEEFRMALAALIASFIAVPIAGVKDGMALKKEAQTLYSVMVNDAGINNSNEGFKLPAESDYVTCRY